MKIRIMSVEIDLVENDPGIWERGAIGRASFKHGQIFIAENIPETTKMQTLMHEVVHVIADMNDLPHMDDAMVSGLSNPLFDFMRQNPELVKRIAGIQNE